MKQQTKKEQSETIANQTLNWIIAGNAIHDIPAQLRVKRHKRFKAGMPKRRKMQGPRVVKNRDGKPVSRQLRADQETTRDILSGHF